MPVCVQSSLRRRAARNGECNHSECNHSACTTSVRSFHTKRTRLFAACPILMRFLRPCADRSTTRVRCDYSQAIARFAPSFPLCMSANTERARVEGVRLEGPAPLRAPARELSGPKTRRGCERLGSGQLRALH